MKSKEETRDLRLLPDGTLVPEGAAALCGTEHWRYVDLVGARVPAELPGWRFIRALVVDLLRQMVEQAGDMVFSDGGARLDACLPAEEALALRLLSAPPVAGAEYW